MKFPTARNDENFAELDEGVDSQLRVMLDALPIWARTSGDRPAEFWERQRAEISSRVAQAQNQVGAGNSRLSWALALGVLALACLLLTSAPRVAPPPRAQVDPDRELLMEVEYAVQSGGPQALEPAALLADEISQHEQISSVSPDRKEVNDEE